jgi:protein-tyrosine phosphatase
MFANNVPVEQLLISEGTLLSVKPEDALREMAITPRGADRFPRQCTVDDLAGADFLVAVKEAEHRPLMRGRFGEWEHLTDYWNVHDVEDVGPAEALPLLTQEVRTLLLCFG